ncbi:MAG TPA: lytic transglycosylase domain-containing protein [Steroidobacteraceae bacterium]|nr:lytic transglycosylase domain-containing protein [Steroidobacteraceae bacterium]
MRFCLPLVIAVLFGGAGLPRAYADIYAFSDADGTHYSNVPNDRRYALLLTEPQEPAPRARADSAGDWRHRAAAYSGLINEAARQAELQPALLRAVVAVESAFDPQAVSRKGAKGLMQLRPATARRYGVERPFDPAENLRGGAHYLSDLLKRYGSDLELALAAYNAGEDAVDRHGRAIPPFAETRAYVPAVLRMYRKFLDVHLAWYARTLPPST